MEINPGLALMNSPAEKRIQKIALAAAMATVRRSKTIRATLDLADNERKRRRKNSGWSLLRRSSYSSCLGYEHLNVESLNAKSSGKRTFKLLRTFSSHARRESLSGRK